MKLYTLYFLFNLLFCNSVLASVPKDSSSSRFDYIDKKHISINGVFINTPVQNMLDKIGQMDNIKEFRNEFDGSLFYYYVYNNTRLIVKENLFVGFEIFDEKFLFDYGKIKVGGTINKVKELFPVSAKNEYAISSGETVIKVRISKYVEDYILFRYKNERITSIITWENY